MVYVHGYWTDADGAWREHNLARQFRASRQNALFIVPDAPASNEDAVKWPALKDLRRAIARANIKLPDGPTIVMGHSGAFRTVMQWVDHRLVEQIILLDAMYAGEHAFDNFIESGKRANQHKLVVVAAGTAQSSESFAKKYKFAVAREKMPSDYEGFTKRQRGAKLLYIRSQYEHMQIVTSGKVIPVLLRLTPLKSCSGRPLHPLPKRFATIERWQPSSRCLVTKTQAQRSSRDAARRRGPGARGPPVPRRRDLRSHRWRRSRSRRRPRRQPLSDAGRAFLTVAFLAATARDLGARKVGLVAPYLAFMRQDVAVQARRGRHVAYFARLVSGMVDWLVTVDPHLHRHASLEGLYTIPTTIARVGARDRRVDRERGRSIRS